MIKQKEYPELGLKVHKYTRKVFQKNLWHEDPMYVEARGLVTDYEGNIVSYPFTKCFNLGENGTTVDGEREVACPRKVNGFMAATTLHKGEMLVSTTGTVDSDFVGYAKEILGKTNAEGLVHAAGEDYTFMYEIVHPNDPHIVHEEVGAYLIGGRHNVLGSPLLPEEMLNDFARMYKLKRPSVWYGKFKDLDTDVKHEGYMIRDANTGELLAKLKSKHYLVKKFLMRSKKAYNRKQVEEEYYDLIQYIRDTFTEAAWIGLGEQERGRVVEEFFS